MKIITLLMCISICSSVSASHIVGGEATYSFVQYNEDRSEATYEITFIVYRDQKGIDFEPYATFGVYEFTESGEWISQSSISNIPIFSIEAFSATDDPCRMQALSDIKVESGTYKFQITLPVIDQYYKIAYQKCCRNHTINNIESAGTSGAVYDIKISSEAQQMGNSSPVFTDLPPTYICVNNEINYSHAAMDPDGDDIRYSFCTPYVAGGIVDYEPQCCDCQSPDVEFCPPPFTPVTYQSGYSYENPIGGSPAISIDPITGIISGVPDQIGSYVVGVCVTEYRDGKIITKIRRDFEFNVVSCFQALKAQIKADSVYTVDNNGQDIDIYEYTVCNQETVAITNLSTDENYIENYTWEIYNDSGAITINSSGLDERDINFSLTESGTYTGAMILNNGQACTDTAYLKINVIEEIEIDYDYSYDPCYISPILFNASFVSTSSDIVKWEWNFGDGETSEEPSPTHNYNSPGNYPVSLTITDNYLCEYSIQKIVDYLPNTEEIIPELILAEELICQGDSLYFDSKWIKDIGSYSYTIATANDMCDSIIYNLDLSFYNEPIEEYSEEYICYGDAILFDGSMITTPGVYTQYIPYLGEQCDSMIKIMEVLYSELPAVYLTPDTTITIRSDFYIPLTIDGLYENIEWTPQAYLDCENCMQPLVNLESPQQFGVTITNQDGCPQERSIFIDVEENNDFYISNIISANNPDPKNRVLYVQSRSEIDYTYDMRIYDRYGNLIHECLDAICNNKDQGWTPENINPGVFVYVITFTDEHYKETLSGGITVLE